MKLNFSRWLTIFAVVALLFTISSAVREGIRLSWPYAEARVTKVEWKSINKHDSPPVCCVPLLYLDVNGREILVSPFRRYLSQTDRMTFEQSTTGSILKVQVNPKDADELIMEPGFSLQNFPHTFAGAAVFAVLAALAILYKVLERKKLF